MPSAVPFQQGLIGQYNNSTSNPGIYVSWDPNVNVPSTQSLIFRGLNYSNYRFPLIVTTYTNNSSQTKLSKPIAVGSGVTYNYLVTDSKFIVYQKQQEVFNTIYQQNINSNPFPSALPNTFKTYGIGATEYLFFGYDQSGYSNIYTYSSSNFNFLGTTFRHTEI